MSSFQWLGKGVLFREVSSVQSVCVCVCVCVGLTRQRLVCLAYLLGSDYTPRLDGVGVVNAMEVIGHFKGEGLDILQKLK